MCLIVDANQSSIFFGPDCGDLDYIKKCLFGTANRSDIRIVLFVGGKLKKELDRVSSAKLAVAILLKGGRARIVPDSEVNALESSLIREGILQSDDPHVIALARISGARLLISKDELLVSDFTNGRIMSPPGRVYRGRDHDHLLIVCCS